MIKHLVPKEDLLIFTVEDPATMARDKDQILQDEKCKDIVALLEAAYDLSSELTGKSGISPSNRDSVSLGLHIMRDNVMEALDLREVIG